MEKISKAGFSGSVLELRQVFEIVQIFVPAGGFLVDFEISEINQVGFNAIQSIDDATRVAF